MDTYRAGCGGDRPSRPDDDATILRAFSRVVLCHFEIVSEEISRQCSGPAYQEFQSLWEWFGSWPISDKVYFCSGPAAFDWIGRSRFLIERNLVARYQDTYLLPHLRALTIALLSYVSKNSPPSSGDLWPAGGRFIPLSLGRLIIMVGDCNVTPFAWSLGGDRLTISDRSGHAFAEAILGDLGLQSWKTGAISAYSSPCINGRPFGTNGTFYRCSSIPPELHQRNEEILISTWPKLPSHREELSCLWHSSGWPTKSAWSPGHLEVSASTKGYDLAGAIRRDLEQRKGYIARLGVQDSRDTSDQSRDERVSFDFSLSPSLRGHGSLNARLTRAGNLALADWSLIDFLTHKSREELLAIISSALDIAGQSVEAANYLMAGCLYCLGRHEECLNVLQADGIYSFESVEEMRLLRAFALRHSSRIREFEKIVFRSGLGGA